MSPKAVAVPRQVALFTRRAEAKISQMDGCALIDVQSKKKRARGMSDLTSGIHASQVEWGK